MADLDRFGVDRLSLSFPLADPPDERLFHGGTYSTALAPDGVETFGVVVPLHTRRVRRRGAWRDEVTHAVHVGAQLGPKGWYGKVETNPSRYDDPEGCTLTLPDQLPRHIEAMAELACEHLNPAPPIEEWAVARVDVARDYRDVADPAATLAALLPLRRPYARRVLMYADPALGGAQTLAAGSGAGITRLYDQHAAYAAKGAPAGSLRWEVQARKDWASKCGITTTATLTPHTVTELAARRWDWSRMGASVEHEVTVASRIAAMVCQHKRGPRGARICGCDGLTQAAADRLLGEIVRESCGVTGFTGRTTTWRYQRLRDELSAVIAPALRHGQATTVIARRLDFTTGRELAA